jgi:hypothetical protein
MEPEGRPAEDQEEFVETGRIEILVGMNQDGQLRRGYRVVGMTPYEALGQIEVVAEVVKRGEVAGWIQATEDNG